MKIISIVSRKGGVGKTATAQTFGAGLKRKGNRVLFVDLDSQSNLSFSTGAQFKGPGIPNSLDLLTGNATATEAIQKTEQGDVIPSCEALAAADVLITETGKEYRLKEALEPIARKYDYCIIDTPAALGTVTVNALTASDYAIVPAEADIYSIQGISQLKTIYDSVKKYCNKDLKIKGILLTRYSGRGGLSKDMKAELEKASKLFDTKVFNTTIRQCIDMKKSQALRKDLFTYKPKCTAAQDYAALIDEFMQN